MLKTVLSLSFVVASRFFGLFIVLPVLSAYALSMKGANEFKIGLLVGGYALVQMLLQVPFGILSDKIGRKFSMLIGLIIFIIGSIICALSNDINTLLIGRFIQGAGAIGAVAIAMISDFTPENSRSKAMAIMGGMIGMSFGLAMIISPLMAANFGLESLFYFPAALSVLAIILLFSVVPKENKISKFESNLPFFKLFGQKNLLIMNFSNLIQKMFLSSIFVAIPIILTQKLGLAKENLWIVYLVAVILGLLAMGLAGFLGDGKGLSKLLLALGILIFLSAFLILGFGQNLWIFSFGVVLFFMGFNLHEPIMQSMASKFAFHSQKGAALGIFNAFGYFGSFLGGVFAGYILGAFGFLHLCEIYVAICILWFISIKFLTNPSNFSIYQSDIKCSKDFLKIQGIYDIFSKNDKCYIKFDKTKISFEEIKSLLIKS